jgi:hypothetical protein
MSFRSGVEPCWPRCPAGQVTKGRPDNVREFARRLCRMIPTWHQQCDLLARTAAQRLVSNISGVAFVTLHGLPMTTSQERAWSRSEPRPLGESIPATSAGIQRNLHYRHSQVVPLCESFIDMVDEESNKRPERGRRPGKAGLHRKTARRLVVLPLSGSLRAGQQLLQGRLLQQLAAYQHGSNSPGIGDVL